MLYQQTSVGLGYGSMEKTCEDDKEVYRAVFLLTIVDPVPTH